MVRRRDFRKTDIAVKCRNCGEEIPAGSACVTLVSDADARVSFHYRSIRTVVPIAHFDGTMKISAISGRAPFVACELAPNQEEAIVRFTVEPTVEYVHPLGCGVAPPKPFRIYAGSFGMGRRQ